MCFIFRQLTAEQRRDMCDYRERALQARANRQNQRKTSVLSQVQNILDLAVQQVRTSARPTAPKYTHTHLWCDVIITVWQLTVPHAA